MVSHYLPPARPRFSVFGIYVHRVIQGQHEKRIEQRTTRKKEEA